jgi:protein-tyrosine phosphatase
VNAAMEVSNFFPQDFTYPPTDFSFDDSSEENITKKFEIAWEMFEKAKSEGVSVYCHCQAGISRSASLVISYIMKYEKKTLKVTFHQKYLPLHRMLSLW